MIGKINAHSNDPCRADKGFCFVQFVICDGTIQVETGPTVLVFWAKTPGVMHTDPWDHIDLITQSTPMNKTNSKRN